MSDRHEQIAQKIANTLAALPGLYSSRNRVNYITTVLECEFPEPVEGSWPWALEQMRAGKRVVGSDIASPICIRTNGAIMSINDNPEVDCFTFEPRDFERTDWRISE